MQYKAIVGFSGTGISAFPNQIVEIHDKRLANDLLAAEYICPINDENLEGSNSNVESEGVNNESESDKNEGNLPSPKRNSSKSNKRRT